MNNKNSNLLRYQKYFDNWDSVSSVRSKPNRYYMTRGCLDTELHDRRWFIREGVPILEHTLLKGIDREREQYLLGRFLLQFLEYGTILEHEFVNTILADMALGETGVPLPDRMRIDAFKIYTDEAYHAKFNMEATQQIRDYIGMPVSEAWPLQNSRLIGLRKLIPQDKSKENFLVRFGIVVASETIAPKELSETMKGIVVEPIYNIFVDHAEDEKKHCMFFSALFEVVWNYLSDDEKQYLGLIFPKILKSFVDINKIVLFDSLAKIGIDQASAKAIIDDSYPEDFCVKRAFSVASSTFFNLERLGVYNIPGVRETFVKEGFFRAQI